MEVDVSAEQATGGVVGVSGGVSGYPFGHWRPIETAPRDGTQIIVYVPFVVTPHEKQKSRKNAHHAQARTVSWAKWAENPMHPMKDRAKFLDEQHGGYWSLDKKGRKPLYACPTHWMPFERPPTTPPKDAMNQDARRTRAMGYVGQYMGLEPDQAMLCYPKMVEAMERFLETEAAVMWG